MSELTPFSEKRSLRAKKVRQIVAHPSFAGAAGRYQKAVREGSMSERTNGWLTTATAKIMHDCNVCDSEKVLDLYLSRG